MGSSRSYLAIAALGAGTLFSLTRVFSEPAWIPPVVGAFAAALAVSALLVRRVGTFGRTAISVAMMTFYFSAFVVPDSFRAGLPDVSLLLRVARRAFGSALDATTLLRPEPRYLLIASAAAWLAVVVCEPVASSGRALVAALPWIGLFGLASAVGVPRGRSAAVVIFVAGLLVATYLIKPVRSAGAGARSETDRASEVRTTSWAAALGGIATASAIVLAPLIPGYKSPPLLRGGLQGPSTQTVVSPLVQIKPQLLDQNRTILFEVRTPPGAQPTYWRLMSLDHFDGQAWSASAEYKQVRGRIEYPASEAFRGTTVTSRQSFKLRGLGNPWLPSSYQVAEVSKIDSAVDPSSSALIARRRFGGGQTYDVISRVPSLTSADLISLPPATISDRFTSLTGVPDNITRIAQSWTAGKTDAYDKVLAITDHLRRFRYDENVPAGHASNQLLVFLTQTRAGYCEQFAASMAVLARSLGIPARVAVGFLPGNPDPSGAYIVNTREAHAWPEIYFEGIGWVAFEPTPREGLTPPGYSTIAAPSGVEEVQPGGGLPATPSPPPESPAPPSPSPSPTDHVRQQRLAAPSLWWRFLLLVAVATATLGGLMVAKALRRRRRLTKATSAGERVRAAFLNFEDRAIDLARARTASQTPAEFVRRIRKEFRLDEGASSVLLGVFEKTSFSSASPSEDEALGALKAAVLLSSELWARSGWMGRVWLLVSPRSLLIRAPRR